MTNTDAIRAELEDLRIAGNSPKVGLYDMRRIYRRRAELFALLAELETKGTNDDPRHCNPNNQT